MLVDSHCHLDMLKLEKYEDNRDKAIAAARDVGVGYFLAIAVDLENFPNVHAIAQQHNDISCSVGVHPSEMKGEDPSVERLVELAQLPKVVAIGETGLDYYYNEGDLEWQRERFRRHIQAAHQVNKPLIIHTRDAREDTINILRQENAQDVGGVLHCFTESWEMAQQGLDLDFYVSLSGIVTFKNAKDLQETAKKIPLDRLLIETDSPYLAPVPVRGKPNFPENVIHVANFVAELRDMPVEALIEITGNNFFQLFSDIPQPK